MNQVAQTQAKPPALRDLVEKMKTEFAKALPGHITPDKFVRTAQTALALTRNIERVRNPQSLMAACVKAATDGLILDGREAALVVDYQGDVQYRPMFQGLVELAYRSGVVRQIACRVVCEADEFEYILGDEERIVHKINVRVDRGAPIAVYCVITLTTGGVIRELMTVAEVNGIRDRSDAFRAFKAGKIKSTPWSTDWEEMSKKTVFRRAQKLLPRSPELERFHQAVERIDEDYAFEAGQAPAQAPVKARGAAATILKDITPEPEQKAQQKAQDEALADHDQDDSYGFDAETGEIMDGDPI